ncbi:MAG: hypothetical protein HeimC2_39500 [Candidatus Heimdallarchaeota archaeon LC_2]|nr:MAG: hypothetical protein HeimC2_39500 [Candidatus Heimdallarchaeota archaeon LC_2]
MNDLNDRWIKMIPKTKKKVLRGDIPLRTV